MQLNLPHGKEMANMSYAVAWCSGLKEHTSTKPANMTSGRCSANSAFVSGSTSLDSNTVTCIGGVVCGRTRPVTAMYCRMMPPRRMCESIALPSPTEHTRKVCGSGGEGRGGSSTPLPPSAARWKKAWKRPACTMRSTTRWYDARIVFVIADTTEEAESGMRVTCLALNRRTRRAPAAPQRAALSSSPCSLYCTSTKTLPPMKGPLTTIPSISPSLSLSASSWTSTSSPTLGSK
mmetsp:Transcript_10291/g.34969  ORF Transcript_10291/g.34969 Transcript_10291/m.34969 type:complete len:234 (+) Transcript_10291:871-1572(+)